MRIIPTAWTPIFRWPVPAGTDKPDVVGRVTLLAEAIEATVNTVAGAVAHLDTRLADTSQTADEARSVAGDAKMLAEAALPAKYRVWAGQRTAIASATGTMQITFPAGAFTAPPIVMITPTFNIAETAAEQIWVGDGTTLTGVTKDSFWVGGLQPNGAARISWMAVAT